MVVLNFGGEIAASLLLFAMTDAAGVCYCEVILAVFAVIQNFQYDYYIGSEIATSLSLLAMTDANGVRFCEVILAVFVVF